MEDFEDLVTQIANLLPLDCGGLTCRRIINSLAHQGWFSQWLNLWDEFAIKHLVASNMRKERTSILHPSLFLFDLFGTLSQ